MLVKIWYLVKKDEIIMTNLWAKVIKLYLEKSTSLILRSQILTVSSCVGVLITKVFGSFVTGQTQMILI